MKIGALGRTRTGTLITATDFKSVVATITPLEHFKDLTS